MIRTRSESPPKVGLALGSGSARGWAHVGVYHALEELGIKIDCIAGSSIGALAGAVFASAGTERLLELAADLDWRKLSSYFDIVFPRSGLVDGKKVADFMRTYVRETRVEDLPIPFRAVAVDLADGSEVVIEEGDLIEAVRASIAFPGVFTPVRRGDRILVDGGLVNPVPVSVLRKMGAEFVIAVDLNQDIVEKKRLAKSTRRTRAPQRRRVRISQRLADRSKILTRLDKRLADFEDRVRKKAQTRKGKEKLPTIFDVLLTSFNILESQVTAARLVTDPPDLLIQPNLGHIRFLEFHKAREAVDMGYLAAVSKLAPLVESRSEEED